MSEASRMLNFSAGPSALPLPVLKQAQQEMLNYNGSGCSVMELSHRSTTFDRIIKDAERDLRELLSVPPTYKVLFMQGGGTGQFAAIPLNLCPKLNEQKADYLVTGTWSRKAAEEAKQYVQVNLVTPKTSKYTRVPPASEWNLSPDAAYFYYCDNETIHGVEFPEVPDVSSCPIVCDMSSNILTRPVDISKFGVIFAGAQKNLGPAGVTIVIVREDLVAVPASVCPSILAYKVFAENDSLYHTPPTYAIYLLGLVLKWIKSEGGVSGMQARSAAKSQAIYDLIDQSGGFYVSNIDKACRSRTNIPFRIRSNDALEKKFLKEAENAGMIQLKGHRSIGGIRASVFNAMDVVQAMKLIEFMKRFQKANQ
ncbi:phosphoserine aminotransferase-like isoform X2 [Varroa jacobsoni]|uniref:Phosphoserine aminotransferase n=2 Tax=Varroa TaxID=62624 RepID=A0A7M7JLY5_VARDE|nr:phosphoserine aminotransferase-like [Varroa destructor]XP_022704417.1 phosphoserine aminotransferase-like isoform X2 [Varroa jacobsoni]